MDTAALQGPAKVQLMGLDFAALTERDTINHVLEGLAAGRGGQICTANLDVLRQWRASSEVRQLVSCADLVVADGMPLIWAGGLHGSPLPERVAGSTLIVTLTAAAAEVGASIFLLGGNPGTAEAAGRKLCELAPGLRVGGTLCPPVDFENQPAWLEEIEHALRRTTPDIVYVALGFPKQERLIVQLRRLMPEAWFVGVGISFSFLAGDVHRAPLLVQRLGLEWLHRMLQEPGRLYRRYLLQGIPFLFELLRWALAARSAQATRPLRWVTELPSEEGGVRD